MKPLYIFDIDGTLANLEHRLHFITRPMYSGSIKPAYFKPDWDAFHANVADDSPIYNVLTTMHRLMGGGAEIWFFTGRMESCKSDTLWWLRKVACVSGSIVLEMRPNGDYRPDTIVKYEMLDNMLLEDRDRLVAVFDDRISVVEMWRANGVTCFQCAKGDF